MSYTIQIGTVDDFKEACDWTSKTNEWHRSYHDFETYQKAYGKENVTFLVAKDNELNFLGCGMIAKAKCGISTVSMYYVLPDHRGKGIGNAIFAKLTEESIQEGRNIGLNATAKLSKKFDANYGFNKYQKWRVEIIRFRNVQPEYILQHYGTAENCKVVSVSDVDLSQLISYDSKITGGLDRSSFVEAWTSHPDGCAKVAVDTKSGEIIGYAMGRLVTKGFLMFCPLYAEDDATAEQLILALFNQDKNIADRTGVFFSITPNMNRLMEISSKFAEVQWIAYVTNQFTQEVPVTNHEKVYCISDSGLGFI